jgi:hypothetical protein
MLQIVLARTLDGTPLAEGLRNFLGPLFIVILAIVAITQLGKWKWANFVHLILAGVAVAILLYRPDVIFGLSQIIADLLPGAGARVPTG